MTNRKRIGLFLKFRPIASSKRLSKDCYTRVKRSMALIIRSSAIHAAGCYTTEPIKNRTRVVEYTGPRISKEQADIKYENSPTTYLFGIGNGAKVIDGHGIAMFINHSCDPNCETDEARGHVWIRAIVVLPMPR